MDVKKGNDQSLYNFQLTEVPLLQDFSLAPTHVGLSHGSGIYQVWELSKSLAHVKHSVPVTITVKRIRF